MPLPSVYAHRSCIHCAARACGLAACSLRPCGHQCRHPRRAAQRHALRMSEASSSAPSASGDRGISGCSDPGSPILRCLGFLPAPGSLALGSGVPCASRVSAKRTPELGTGLACLALAGRRSQARQARGRRDRATARNSPTTRAVLFMSSSGRRYAELKLLESLAGYRRHCCCGGHC